MNAAAPVSANEADQAVRDHHVRYIGSHAALRGLAALLVVAYHLQLGAAYRLPLETATPLFERGYLLVDLFFILSGFIISLTNKADRGRPFGKAETYDFLVARLARIYPLHLFCLCGIVCCTLGFALLRQWHHGAPLALRVDPGAVRSFFAELFLVQAWIPGAPYWNIPSWSISSELFAYLVFPLILVLRSRLPRLTSFALLALPLAYYLSVMLGTGSLDVITGPALLRCLSGFMLGIIVFDLRQWAARWRQGVTAVSQLAAVVAIVAVLATRCPDPVIIPFFALLVITTWQDRGPVPAALRHRAFARSGDLSYSIYLTHVGVIAIVTPLWYALVAHGGIAPFAARIAFVIICFAAVVVASQWTYVHVEQTGRRRLRRLLSRSKAR